MRDLGLMTGFPPTPGHQVTLANWRSSPFNRWAFQHVRELVPSANIPGQAETVWMLPEKKLDLSGLSFEHAGAVTSYRDFLHQTDTDGLVILHRGILIDEHYANDMEPRRPHILMSVSKSILGIIAGILAERDVLRLQWDVTEIIPELKATAYAGAAIEDLLDMRAGVEFDEDYAATSGIIVEYRKSHGWNPPDPGDPPSDLRTFFERLVKADGSHGGRFHYVSPNTDVLGWIIERLAKKRYADLVSELLWRPLGAADDAYITVDRLGAPRCAGGVCATVRDLARLGQLIVRNGRRSATQIIPEAWIKDVIEGGDRIAWNRGDFAEHFPGFPIHYRHQWYVLHDEKPIIFAFGVNGQHLFIDPHNEVVVAKVSSQKMPIDVEQISLMICAVRAVRDSLSSEFSRAFGG